MSGQEGPRRSVRLHTDPILDHEEINEDNEEVEQPAAAQQSSQMTILTNLFQSLLSRVGARKTDGDKDEEKLLKSAISAITNVSKLTTENWYSWDQDVRMSLGSVPKAIDIIDAKIMPGNAAYDTNLDGRILNAMRSAMEMDGPNGVRAYVLQAQNASSWTAGALFQHLKNILTRNDKFFLSKAHQKVANLQMFGNDVRKLCSELDGIWAHSLALGKNLGDDYKLSSLRDKVARNHVYLSTFSNMEDNGNADDYVKVSRILMAKQDDLDSRPILRVARTAQEQPVHEGYWRGWRDPKRLGEPAKCFTCGKEGHIARKCTSQAKTEAGSPG